MSEKKADLASIMQVLQVFVLAVGLAGVFVKLGEGQAVQRQNTGQLEGFFLILFFSPLGSCFHMLQKDMK